MQQPLYSVLMANFNRAEYIDEAITSVLNQTYPNLELIIVDDGSTDQSPTWIQQWAERDHRIRYKLNKVNKGCGATMRECAELAQGEYMGYMGSDDVIAANTLEEVMGAHHAHPECSIVNSSHFVCDENLRQIRKAYGACAIPENESYLTYGAGVTSFASFARKYYEQTQGVNKDFKRAVDQDLYYKLEEVGGIHFLNKELYYYRVNEKGISTTRNLGKSRYWFARAKEDAYKRRQGQPGVFNVSQDDLDAWWSLVYITKSAEAFWSLRFCRAAYWLQKSLRRSLFDKFFKIKMKTLLLNSPIHRMMKT